MKTHTLSAASVEHLPPFDEVAARWLASSGCDYKPPIRYAFEISAYVSPVIGSVPVDLITIEIILDVLRALLNDAELSAAVYLHLENILAYALRQGMAR
jgi:hypothetical protein